MWGSGTTVKGAEFGGSDSMSVRGSSTFRMVVDLGSLDRALIAIAPGESEHPQHPHFRDGVDGWLAGRSQFVGASVIHLKVSRCDRLLICGGRPVVYCYYRFVDYG